VFDDIRHVHGRAVDTGLFERAIEQPSGRTDEGMAGHILGVPRLLSHYHDRGPRRSFTKHRLRPTFIQIAGFAPF
jgi:hypothetical protein